jgi:hypothetical protein
MEGRYISVQDAEGELHYTEDWNELRNIRGVAIECSRHPGRWWPTPRQDIAAAEVQDRRCPDGAWAFRQRLGKGTPQF